MKRQNIGLWRRGRQKREQTNSSCRGGALLKEYRPQKKWVSHSHKRAAQLIFVCRTIFSIMLARNIQSRIKVRRCKSQWEKSSCKDSHKNTGKELVADTTRHHELPSFTSNTLLPTPFLNQIKIEVNYKPKIFGDVGNFT